MDDIIRKVRPGDENALAQVQTESWKAGFRHILTNETLEQYTNIARVTAMYQRLLESGRGNGYILEIAGKPHCIAWWDETREADMPGYAELICIHSLPDNWRKGYGTRMMARVMADMRAAGWTKAMLWVFAKNERARSFYEANGFAASSKTKTSFDALEICYEREL